MHGEVGTFRVILAMTDGCDLVYLGTCGMMPFNKVPRQTSKSVCAITRTLFKANYAQNRLEIFTPLKIS